MHLNRIQLAGYRSFSPDAPFELRDLGRMNVLLGPNGVGKSNLGRFASWLRQMLEEMNRALGQPLYTNPLLLRPSHEPVDSWQLGGADIIANFWVDAAQLPSTIAAPARWLDPEGGLQVEFKATLPQGGAWLATLQPIAATGQHFFRADSPDVAHPEVLTANLSYRSGHGNEEHGQRPLALDLCQLLQRRWLHVHALRHPHAPGSLGDRTRREVYELFKNEAAARRWQGIRRRLEAWTGRLLGQRVKLDVLEYDFRVTRGSPQQSELQLALQQAGDGVAQYVYLLAGLLLHPEDPAVVFIDEPEAHLHPGATLELLRIIDEELPHVQAIIATHSPAVVDALAPDWRFWRVSRDDNGASRAERVETQASRIAALDSLGIHASQIFMARTVVWVEGPSDVVYYRALLAEVDPSLVAGRDYAFALFGGSNGTHFAVDGDGSLGEVIVDVLRLAHRNVFIHDKDAKPASRARVDQWREQIESAGVKGQAFATPGREVENLVHPEVLLEAARATVKTVAAKARRITVTFGAAIDLGPDSPFAPALANSVRGRPAKALRDSVAAQLHNKKHQLAREVARIAAERRKGDNAKSVFRPEAIAWAKEVVDAIRR
ncbi:MAG: AAA family ATPase [Deltaproteobacteria bacterium]|nr:AAA family ATPase [Deltaproteobacteria bacterium]MBK8715814.1 AAA family ATPase [Deltaproteobacteria bacterium]MBP7291814.1 AAA family ATPase [Nannocystaceae bacterium]